jgi:hypothetical protein
MADDARKPEKTDLDIATTAARQVGQIGQSAVNLIAEGAREMSRRLVELFGPKQPEPPKSSGGSEGKERDHDP